MLRRLLVVTILTLVGFCPASAQSTEDPTPRAPLESPPPPPEAVGGEHSTHDRAALEPRDAAMALSDARGAVRLAPDHAGPRLALARALYRIGDLDAALEECRAAIKLQSNDATAHVQLGTILIAKQDWRAAESVLHEAVRLDPGLADAHYSLGAVQYSLGHSKAAVQSYRQALTLQPYFPDARYRLALLLKLSKHQHEAAQLMEEAAVGGVPQAQFFLANAYKSGDGVEPDLGRAVFWWAKAAEYGYQPAIDLLSKLRRQALLPERSDRKRKDAQDAFLAYRRQLWEDYREYSSSDDGETLGTRLLKDGRPDAAVAILLKEGYALSEVAQHELERLYEAGSNPVLAPHDKKILACFELTAADGYPPAKRILARIYGKGIGVQQDLSKAKALLKGLSKPEANALLAEFGSRELR
ncbi:MAG TPA: tetratricopeptide repeat protein [Nitrospira sp.]|nr:tetratricopeptide repeat protein [Nitrospira sp.]